MQVLGNNQDTSESFRISGSAQIVLKGAISADWTVEVSVDDGTSWQQDDDVLTSSELSAKWDGSEEFLYRINLGSGNGGADTEGHVGGIRQQYYTGVLLPS